MTVPRPGEAAHTKGLPIVATLGALGIVYGDIGTSPLYALKEAAKAAAHGGPLISDAILGVVSLILWALILIISVKYALLILRADNRGEGGIVALLALLSARNAQPGTWRAQLLIVGLVGAALLYGDGAITPAISVLSALEGLKRRCAVAGARRGAAHPHRPDRAFRHATERHWFHRQYIRAGDARLVPGARTAWHPRYRASARGARCREPALRFRFPDPPGFPHQFRRPGRSLSRGDRRRSHVCRHGPFRPGANPARMVRGGTSCARAQLLWTGRAADH